MIKKLCVVAISSLILNILLFQYVRFGYVTNPIRVDGFGAQFQTIIYAAIYAEIKHKKFVYTPFRTMEHNYDNDEQFLAKKEHLINFIDNFKLSKQVNRVECLGPESYIEFFEKHLNRCYKANSLMHIKKLFRANKSRNFFRNDKFNIAIHIRRPNSHDNRIAGADVADQKFLQIINHLKQCYADKDYLLHIYSQGNPEAFRAYVGDRTILHLNESVEDTFTGMVYANALVLSPSSFSYTAGLLSQGDVYYMPFWHAPLRGWKIIRD